MLRVGAFNSAFGPRENEHHTARLMQRKKALSIKTAAQLGEGTWLLGNGTWLLGDRTWWWTPALLVPSPSGRGCAGALVRDSGAPPAAFCGGQTLLPGRTHSDQLEGVETLTGGIVVPVSPTRVARRAGAAGAQQQQRQLPSQAWVPQSWACLPSSGLTVATGAGRPVRGAAGVAPAAEAGEEVP